VTLSEIGKQIVLEMKEINVSNDEDLLKFTRAIILSIKELIVACSSSSTSVDFISDKASALLIAAKQLIEAVESYAQIRQLENAFSFEISNVNNEREKNDRERNDRERIEKQRIEKERIEKQRFENERIEKQRIEKEKNERERNDRERIEKQRIEKERIEKQPRFEKEKFCQRKKTKKNLETID